MKNKIGGPSLSKHCLMLQNAFPETSGFSVRNLHRMRQFAARFSEITIVPQAVAQLPWGHISLLIHKIKDNKELAWYAEQTIEQGWSRLALERQVKDSLFQRQAIDEVKSSNFLTRLSKTSCLRGYRMEVRQIQTRTCRAA